ncbi:MAG: hypothetical protein N2745_03760 [Syntrophorhabdaceae bacterium]|nr:hypothetical protein [Syntrophorhabdaceae bacterium]
MEYTPLYVKTASEGKLEEKIQILKSMLLSCTLCPRRCRVNRVEGKKGYCNAPYELYISSAFPHFGEESPLVGKNGSGTIFLTHCNLRCSFCQNYEISIYGEGTECSTERLAEVMLKLQERGCHNINLVTPTHYVPQILMALSFAVERGLTIPLVYNCGGYESIDVIKILEGIIDIYMPDVKFLDGSLSERYCNARDYPEVVKVVLKEMQQQVGDLVVDEKGIGKRGLLIRHLVMPGGGDDSKRVLDFIKENISENAFVNIMAQYHPCYKSFDIPPLNRRVSEREFLDVLFYAQKINLIRAYHH